jgi:hypothetical protein
MTVLLALLPFVASAASPLPQQMLHLLDHPKALRTVLSDPRRLFDAMRTISAQNEHGHVWSVAKDMRDGYFRPELVEPLVAPCAPYLDGSPVLLDNRCASAIADFILPWRLALRSSIREVEGVVTSLFSNTSYLAEPRFYAVAGLYIFTTELEASVHKNVINCLPWTSAAIFVSHGTTQHIVELTARSTDISPHARAWLSAIAQNDDFMTSSSRRGIIEHLESGDYVPYMRSVMKVTGLPLMNAFLLLADIMYAHTVQTSWAGSVKELVDRGAILEVETELFTEECLTMRPISRAWATICDPVDVEYEEDDYDQIFAGHYGLPAKVYTAVQARILSAWTDPAWVKSRIEDLNIVHILNELINTYYAERSELPASCARGSSLDRCIDELASFVAFQWKHELFAWNREEAIADSITLRREPVLEMIAKAFKYSETVLITPQDFANPGEAPELTFAPPIISERAAAAQSAAAARLTAAQDRTAAAAARNTARVASRGDTVIDFGRHAGATYRWVAENDAGYVAWTRSVPDPSWKLQRMRDYFISLDATPAAAAGEPEPMAAAEPVAQPAPEPAPQPEAMAEEQSATADLVLEDADWRAFEKSARFFSGKEFPEEGFVRVGDLGAKASEKAWFHLIVTSPELLMIRPLHDTAALEFLGKFVRYALTTRRATSLAFSMDVVIPCFLSTRATEPLKPWAEDVKRGFDAFYHSDSRVKVEVRSISAFIYHGPQPKMRLPDMVFNTRLQGWSDAGYSTVSRALDSEDTEIAVYHIRS